MSTGATAVVVCMEIFRVGKLARVVFLFNIFSQMVEGGLIGNSTWIEDEAYANETYHDYWPQYVELETSSNDSSLDYGDEIAVRGKSNFKWDGFRTYNVGVLMASRLDSPFDLEKCGPAVDMALEEINEKFLAAHKIRLNKVQDR